MEFNEDLIGKLKLLVPANILDFGLIYPSHQDGYIRFDDRELKAVYLEGLKDKYNNNVILKFDFCAPNYLFSDIYVCGDKCNEHRYDKDLNLNAVYLKNISIPSNLSKETRLHMLDVLIDWRKLTKAMDSESEFVVAYQIEKNGVKVKNPYIVFKNKIHKQHYDTSSNMVSNFDANKVKYFQKCSVNDVKITKEPVIYLIIDYKQNTNEDG